MLTLGVTTHLLRHAIGRSEAGHGLPLRRARWLRAVDVQVPNVLQPVRMRRLHRFRNEGVGLAAECDHGDLAYLEAGPVRGDSAQARRYESRMKDDG